MTALEPHRVRRILISGCAPLPAGTYKEVLAFFFFFADFDECKADVDGCEINSTYCVNTVGKYRCKCQPGYKASSDADRACININECAQPGACDHIIPLGYVGPTTTNCTDTPGSFKCSVMCPPGHHFRVGKYDLCHNTDECATGQHNCQSTARCVDTLGSFYCQCGTPAGNSTTMRNWTTAGSSTTGR